jgi:PhoH-like ATPase
MAIASMIDLAAHPPKLFVLDTNVLLHDAGCIDHFEENDIAIPITVLEELDRFKRGNEDINFQAREFLRRFDDMVGDLLSPEGVSLGEGRGTIRVVLGGEMDEEVRTAFQHDTPDHRILNTTLRLERSLPHRKVVLVSKDTNLRLKAKSLGILAQDYTSDKIASADLLYSGKRILENAPQELIEAFRKNGGLVPAEQVPALPPPMPNENFHYPQRKRLGAGDLSADDADVQACGSRHGLRHCAAQRRAAFCHPGAAQ